MLYALMSGSSAILWNALESIDSETQSAFLEAFPSELISVGEFKQLLLIVAVLTAILALMQIAILYSIKRRQENVE